MKKNYFTLIEAVLITAIIAAVSSMAYPAILESIQKSNASKCTANLRVINGAKKLWSLDNPESRNLLAAFTEAEARLRVESYIEGIFPKEPVSGEQSDYIVGAANIPPTCRLNGTGSDLGNLNNFHDLGVENTATDNAIRRIGTDLNFAAINTGDANNDGQDDILWFNQSTGEGVIQILGENGEIISSYDFFNPLGSRWEIADFVDLNGDGTADILYRDSITGHTSIGHTGAAEVGLPTSLNTSTYPELTYEGAGDFDGDGVMDFLYHDYVTGDVMINVGLEGEGFVRNVPEEQWRIKGIGDLDNDGNDDVVWEAEEDRDLVVYLMEGAEFSHEWIGYHTDNRWELNVTDITGDGGTDILWHNTGHGRTVLYEMDAEDITNRGIFISDQDDERTIEAVLDVNGDGYKDIIWRNDITGEITASTLSDNSADELEVNL